jgi:hypothetical protein
MRLNTGMTDFIKEWAKGHGPDVVAEMLCDLDEVIKKCEMYNDINSTMKGIPYFDSINRFKSCSWDRVFCPECNEGNWIFIGTPVFGDPRGEQTPWGCRWESKPLGDAGAEDARKSLLGPLSSSMNSSPISSRRDWRRRSGSKKKNTKMKTRRMRNHDGKLSRTTQ